MKKFAIYGMVLLSWFAYGSLDNLATALEKLALEPKPKAIDTTGFLGPWMVQNRPEDLITFSNDFDNTGIPLYQIKVLNQWDVDCWVHSLRNCLYFMDLVASSRSQFDTIYKNMVSRDQYEAFVKDGCPRYGAVTHEFIKELACMPSCIPQNSSSYLKHILNFQYEPEFPHDELSNNKKILTQWEGTAPSDKAVFDYTLIIHKGPQEKVGFNIQQNHEKKTNNLLSFINLILNLQTKDSYMAGFAIGSDYTEHQTSLVVHKVNGKIECLFADSNNMSFKSDNEVFQIDGQQFSYAGVDPNEYTNITRSFREQIKQFLYFITNEQVFNDFAIRTLYQQMQAYFYTQKDYNIQLSGVESWERAADFAVRLLGRFYNNLKYNDLKKYNLLNNALYKSTYKPLYCDLIKKEQAAQKGFDSKHYSNLLKKVGC